MHRARPGSLKRRLNKKAAPGGGGREDPGPRLGAAGAQPGSAGPCREPGRRAPPCAASEGPLRAGSLPLRGEPSTFLFNTNGQRLCFGNKFRGLVRDRLVGSQPQRAPQLDGCFAVSLYDGLPSSGERRVAGHL